MTNHDRQPFAKQDIGYLLTAYADGQLAPEGVMWVEEQLDHNPDLRAKLKEIRQLQAGLRAAFAGGAPVFALDLPRREAVLASAANPPPKRINFMPAIRIALAASVLIMVVVSISTPNLLESRASSERQRDLARGEAAERLYDLDDPRSAGPYPAPSTRPVEAGRLDSARFAVDGLAAAAGEGRTGVGASNGLPADTPLLAKADDELRDGLRDAKEKSTNYFYSGDVTGKEQQPQGGRGGKLARDGESLQKQDSLARADRAASEPTTKSELTAAKQLQSDKAAANKPASAMREREAVAAAPAAPAAPPTPSAPAAQRAPVVVATAPKPALEVAKKADADSDGRAVRKDSEQLKEAAPRQAAPPGAAAPAKAEAKTQTIVTGAPVELTVTSDERALAIVVPLEEKVAEERFKELDERENAKVGGTADRAEAEVGATGAFMAIGAGGGSAGMFSNRTGAAKRRALLGPNKGDDDSVVLKPAGSVTIQVGDGKPAEVVIAITDPSVQSGDPVRITRNDLTVVDGEVQSIQDGRAVVAINSQTWNRHGALIKPGDVVSTVHPAGTIVDGTEATRSPQNQLAAHRPSVVADQALSLNVPRDPQRSLQVLKALQTRDGEGDLSQVLGQLGGDAIGYQISVPAQTQLGLPVSVALRDEPAARGILRAARSANLQAQFGNGLVQLDTATRPLDPADTQGYDLPTFKNLFGTAPMQSIAVDPVQTVAIDADTASYSYAKARVAAGQPVDPATIKPEHFINAMPMDYPAATGPEAFSLYAEAAPSPFARANTAWGARTALVTVGAVAKPAAADERKPLALTLAIDCSGSMAQPGGLERIQRGLLAFVEHLRAEDRVSIVAFGDQARVILPATPGNDRAALTSALMNLATGGATNCVEGLSLAYQLAAETTAPGVESRVLLATDGGTVAGADDLLRRVTAYKDRGITLVVVGTGKTYHAGPLQELATKGDGQHYYVGSDEDAQDLFTGKLLPDRIAVLAKDAKLQVTWNPQRVSHARLVGYDQRRLAAKDFRNNAVDAGELSQDTQVTALFEVLLVDGGTGPLGNAAVRYFDTRRGDVRELACPLPGSILASQPSDRLRLVACAAATAEWLQRGWWSNVHLITPDEIRAQLARCPQPIAAELRAMVK